MLHDQILSAEASIYTEAPDPLGISFVTSELFHGTVAECLGLLARYAPPRRANAYIETIDGTRSMRSRLAYAVA